MEYLKKSFTVAVRTPKEKLPFGLEEFDMELASRDEKRDKPHEYENQGVMCGLCGLDEKAKIHAV